MSVVHWIYCKACERTLQDVRVDLGAMPRCCGEPMRVTWEHGQAPSTDLHEPRYSEAAGRAFRSTRERERYLRDPRNNRWGVSYEPCGDKVGGARTDLSIRNTGFMYPGMPSRTSTGERRG